MPPTKDIERCLWETAYELQANSSLRPSEYSFPVRGLILLQQADRNPPKVHEVDLGQLQRAFRALNPYAPLFQVSHKTGEGLAAWAE